MHKYRFPDPDLMNSLLSLYFEHHNIIYPLIHRPTLEKQLREGLHHTNEAFATTVLLMCALGARYSDDPAVLLGGEDIDASIASLRSGLHATSQEGRAALDAEIDEMKTRWHRSLKHSRGWKYFKQTWDARGTTEVVLWPSFHDVQAAVVRTSLSYRLRYADSILFLAFCSLLSLYIISPCRLDCCWCGTKTSTTYRWTPENRRFFA